LIVIEATAGAPPARPSSTTRSSSAKAATQKRTREDDAPPPADDPQLQQQRAEFDMIARYQAEMYRELNVLRDMMLEQMKHDDEYLKAVIRLI
jgi:hypothetical protein